jgi:hypothetical protein
VSLVVRHLYKVSVWLVGMFYLTLNKISAASASTIIRLVQGLIGRTSWCIAVHIFFQIVLFLSVLKATHLAVNSGDV